MQDKYFSFSQLKGDYPLLEADIRRGTPTAVFGVSDSLKYLVASMVDAPVLYITADHITAQKAADAIAEFSGKAVDMLPAKDEVLTYRKALSKDSLFKRIKAMDGLRGGGVVTAEIDAVMQLFPKSLPKISLQEGESVDFSRLSETLVAMGYTRSFEVEQEGVFALRGDILDIYPVQMENPVRVDFFDDVVEKIKPYDIATGKRLETLSEITIFPATDCFLEEEEKQTIKDRLKKELSQFHDANAYARANAIADELIESQGDHASFLIPLLKNTTDIFSLLSPDTVVIFDEGKSIWDKCESLYKEFEERFNRLMKGGEVFPFSKGQYLAKETLLQGLKKFRSLALQTFTGSPYFFEPMKTYRLPFTPTSKYLNGFPNLLTDVKNWLKGGYRVLLCCGEVGRGEKMKELLAGEYLPVYPLENLLENQAGVCVLSRRVEKGFVLHESKLVVIGSGDLYTKPADKKRVRRKRGVLFVAPEVGDYAVHETHGIGKVVGTKRIETTDGTKEYIALSYKDGDTLYVPVENIDVLSKYVGEADPPLSKIGGADFERVKTRVKASLKKLAFDLKQLYAERAEERGFAFPRNDVFLEEFFDGFSYDLTPDQQSSVEEILEDMYSPKVMDRLLCGDVGFGKTEVAFRAIYLCVLAGKQAAIMCPSTILCGQHFNTAMERFSSYGVKVAALNRFNTPKEQQAILCGLRDGSIDLVIGTHRLLSEDVAFKDLGLLVLDEEQRFGVEHKEKIKHLRKGVDCLTMTATPIPRTLHMSLSGIRDISTIHTPPTERLPVQTYVVEETETLIRDACIRELSRDGQVFILYNRVESIFTFASKIERILPEAKISVAHGRMDKTTLENSVFDFYSGRTNVLITTTIIENGIDLPNANTLIVIDSDRLGISQLYQLKGRVGRGTRLAHAYFTFKGEKVMTSNATERLKAIMEFTELGSGYKLAMRDLEIRGAGNILGAEQHGHMDRVGYELYSKLLKEELTGESQQTAEIEIHADAYIPEEYIESSAGRLDTYKQIAEMTTTADYKRVYESLEDIYGPLPQSVVNLMVASVLKYYATKFHVKRIVVKKGVGAMEFASLQSLGDKRLQLALDKYRSKVRLNMTVAPTIEILNDRSVPDLMAEMTKFLKFALTF